MVRAEGWYRELTAASLLKRAEELFEYAMRLGKVGAPAGCLCAIFAAVSELHRAAGMMDPPAESTTFRGRIHSHAGDVAPDGGGDLVVPAPDSS